LKYVEYLIPVQDNSVNTDIIDVRRSLFMEKVIFVENRFNLISDMGMSWDALLNKLAKIILDTFKSGQRGLMYNPH